MSGRYVLAIDQGTTSTRAMVFDEQARTVALARREFAQHYPASGWVEHDPEDIWRDTLAVVREAIARAGIGAADLRPSASPISARPWSCGSAPAASRSTGRSSGRTGAPPRCARS